MNTQISNDVDVIPGARSALFRGRKHIQKNIPCQDAYATGISGDGMTVMAVADGVSSSPHSEEASRAATKAVIRFWKAFGSYFIGDAEIYTALRASMNYALMETDRLRENCPEAYSFETTLSIVVVDSQRKKLYYSHVGDGGIYLLSKDNTVQLITETMRDEDGSVYALSEGPQKWFYGRKDISQIRAILMVTDGISDVIRAEGNAGETAKLFMKETADRKEYRHLCRKILSEDPFRDMDDDATILFYSTDSIKRMPWEDEPATGADDEPVTGADDEVPALEEETPDTFLSAFQRAFTNMNNLLFKKNRRKK